MTKKYKGKPESSLETLVKIHTSAIIIQEWWREYILKKNQPIDFVPKFDTLKRSTDKTPKAKESVPLLDLSQVEHASPWHVSDNNNSKTIFDKNGLDLSPRRI